MGLMYFILFSFIVTLPKLYTTKYAKKAILFHYG